MQVRGLPLPAIAVGLAFVSSLVAQVGREPVESLAIADRWIAETGGRVDVIDGMVVLDGDIVLGSVADAESGRTGPAQAKLGESLGPVRRDAAIFGRNYEPSLWPDPVIPYVIQDGFSDTQREAILLAISEWNERTVISLVPRTTQEEYVLFQTGGGCRANVGRLRHGVVTNVWLASHCSGSSIVHEIGHAVGLGHEHQRLDRNVYLDVRISPSPETSPGHIASYVGSVGIEGLFNVGPYDFRSVMSYSREIVPLFGGIATYETVPPGIPVENQSAPWLSEGDIDGVARLYGSVPSATVVATNPRGLTVLVDGTPVTAPATFDWPRDSVHTIEAPVAQQRMVFARWNAGGARVRQVIASPDQTWFEANYASPSPDAPESPSEEGVSRFRLWTHATGGATVVTDPPSEDGYYDAGTRVALVAEPGDAGGGFRSWEGTARSYEEATWVDMDGPKVVILHWELEYALYWQRPLDSSPRALQVYSGGSSVPPTQTVRLGNQQDGSWRYRIVSDQPWLSASPARGSVESNGSAEIAVRFHSDGLPPGRYAGRLQILPLPEDGRERKVLELAGVPVELVVGDEPGAAQYLTVRLGKSGDVVDVIHVQGLGFLNSSGRPLLNSNQLAARNGDVYALRRSTSGVVATYLPRRQRLVLDDGEELVLTKSLEGEGEDKWRAGPIQAMRYGRPLTHAGKEYFFELVDGSWRRSSHWVRTVVGNSDVADGIPALAATFNGPEDVTVDGLGNVYVADTQNHRVRKIDLAGTITTLAGTGEYGYRGDGVSATTAQFRAPTGIAADRAGNVYVSDTQNHRVRKIDPAGTITTVAGTGHEGYSGDGGPATLAKLGTPRGLDVDASGNVYVAVADHRVRKIDSAGLITTFAGNGGWRTVGDGGPAAAAEVGYPLDVAADGAGNVYVVGAYARRVRKIDPAGTITTVAGNGEDGYSGDGGPATAAQLESTRRVATGNAGNVYVAEGNYRVREIDATGTITTVAGAGTTAVSEDGGPATMVRLWAPQGLAADATGNLYVVTGANRVHKIDAFGTIRAFAGTGSWKDSNTGPITSGTSIKLSSPTAIAIGALGEVFFVDRHRVWKLDAAGQVSAFAGGDDWGYGGDGAPATEARFKSPSDVAADFSGSVYVADRGNHRVRKIDRTGTITTVAGTGTAGYSGDGGPATAAELYYPDDVAVDYAGNVYVAQRSRIRKIDARGTITTVAGTGEDGYSGDGGPATEAQVLTPLELDTDSTGNVYLLYTSHRHRQSWLRKIDVSGTIDTVLILGMPVVSFATDATDHVILGLEHQILKVGLEAEESVVMAGTGEGGFRGDVGAARSALLSVSSRGIAVDRDGRVWFVDWDNRRIRVVEPVPGAD